MRTFAIVIGTVVVIAVVALGGFLIGQGGFWKSEAIFAGLNENGDLEITSRDHRSIQVVSVVFNDAERIDTCASRPKPLLYTRSWFWAGDNLRWQPRWARHDGAVSIDEGEIVVAPINRAVFGETIVKAEVVTSLGTYVFRYPAGDKAAVGREHWTPMHLDRWYDPR